MVRKRTNTQKFSIKEILFTVKMLFHMKIKKMRECGQKFRNESEDYSMEGNKTRKNCP